MLLHTLCDGREHWRALRALRLADSAGSLPQPPCHTSHLDTIVCLGQFNYRISTLSTHNGNLRGHDSQQSVSTAQLLGQTLPRHLGAAPSERLSPTGSWVTDTVAAGTTSGGEGTPSCSGVSDRST